MKPARVIAVMAALLPVPTWAKTAIARIEIRAAPPAGLAGVRITIFCGNTGTAFEPCHVLRLRLSTWRRRVRHVFRNVEGHWFRATSQWDLLMQRACVGRSVSTP
ncbi:MAG: hypothetical protein WDO72_04495 [Pseudomonadota bacterium]